MIKFMHKKLKIKEYLMIELINLIYVQQKYLKIIIISLRYLSLSLILNIALYFTLQSLVNKIIILKKLLNIMKS